MIRIYYLNGRAGYARAKAYLNTFDPANSYECDALTDLYVELGNAEYHSQMRARRVRRRATW